MVAMVSYPVRTRSATPTGGSGGTTAVQPNSPLQYHPAIEVFGWRNPLTSQLEDYLSCWSS